MATNKIVVQSKEEFMAGYDPLYVPFYPALLDNSAQYTQDVGVHNWRRLSVAGDVRARGITPKDTEMKQISVISGTKSFKKYFFANQYTQSKLQVEEDVAGIVAQVLDEHQKQFDELVLLGDSPTTASDNTQVVNNGLYWSQDTNYTLKTATSGAAATDFFAAIMASYEDARDIGGDKLIVVYGSGAIGKLNTLMSDQSTTLRNLVEGNTGDGSIVKLPADITPASANGYMIVSKSAVKMHYVALPKLEAQGVNEEKMYSWHNFLMGSAMVELQRKSAIIRQPISGV